MLTNVSHRMEHDVKDLTVQQVSPISYAIAACYMACITLLGILVNAIVFYVILTDNKLRSPMNAILINLACSDLGIALFGNPIALYNALNGGWTLGRNVCVIYGFLMSLFGICSIFTLTVLAYERYHIICHPFSITSHLTWQEAKLSIVGTWVASFVASSPPLFGWGAYENEAANISCSINWESREWNATSYILFLFAIAMIVPIFVITFSYYNIIRTMRQVKRMKQTQSMGVVSKAETHVARMLLMMVAAFFIAWGPYAVFSLIIAFTDIPITPTFSMAPSLFAKSSVCYNPIIYFFLNQQFRKSWSRRLRVNRFKDDTSIEIGHIQLSKIRSPPVHLQNVEPNNNRALITETSSVSSSPSVKNGNSTQFQNRDVNLINLIPYNTLPFIRRKQILKTRSLPKISILSA